MSYSKVDAGKAFVETVFAGYGIEISHWERTTAFLRIDRRLEPCTFQRTALEDATDHITAPRVREHIRVFLEECRLPVAT